MKTWRGKIVLAIFLAIGTAMLGRLFFLQIWEHKFYRAQALGQQTGFGQARGARGEIFFTNSQDSKGAVVLVSDKSAAINLAKWKISAAPAQIEDKEQFAKNISDVFGEPAAFILPKLQTEETYVVIRRGVEKEELKKIQNLNLKGLLWDIDSARYYPQEDFGAHVIGFVGGGGEGQYGVEGFYEDVLSADKSFDGSNIYLTVDYNIQFEAERLLAEAKENIGIQGGQILVLKPDSGRILALASYPEFNPNQYGKVQDMFLFQNPVVQKIFEPGSVMKPFTLASAINEGKITPETTFEDTGFLKIGRDTLYNFGREKYGIRTMTEVLEKSINTGAVFAQQQVGKETFWDYFQKFGFIKKTEVDLQGEVYSRNENLQNGPDFNYATASFGQGVEITPIQLARAFCAFANGGRMPNPHVSDTVATELSQQVITQKTAEDITKMLVSVVEKGFGSEARMPGYYLAGKTGTAEVPIENGKGYYSDRTIQSFIGYGPAEKPQFLILVKLDWPKVSASSLSAAPIFKKMAQHIIDYWKIPPDYDINK